MGAPKPGRIAAVAGLVALAAMVVGALVPRRGDGAPAGAASGATPSAAVPSALTGAPPAAGGAGIGRRDPAPKGAVVFPDGTWLPSINGVTDPPPFPGFGGRPYSPVVQVYTNPQSGLQWYVHADGTESGVQYSQTPEHSPGWLIGRPIPNQPLHDDPPAKR